MKAKIMLVTILLTAGLGIGTANTSVHAATWHKGFPKALRGNWYLYKNKKPISRLRAVGRTYAYNDIWYSSHYHAYYNNFSYDFLANSKYRYIGNHKYVISGKLEGGQNPNPGTRQSHVVKVGKQHIKQYGVTWTRHHPKRFIGVKQWLRHPG